MRTTIRSFAPAVSAIFLFVTSSGQVFGEELFSRPLFGAIDSQRAIYGKSRFPEPLLAPEMDVESELRLDWFHSEKSRVRADSVKAELEYSIGYLTLEVAGVYENREEVGRDTVTGRDIRSRSEGIGNIELAARYPVFSFVSSDGGFEYTVVGAFELALPSGSRISKDTEVVPAGYQLMRFGRHLTLQTSVGLSSLIGPEKGGVNTLEYAVVLGYSIEPGQFHLPGLQRIIPLVEIVGERAFNGEDKGVNRTSATIGGRLIFDALEKVQPRLGIGFVLPINGGARDDFRWGVITSLAFEF